MAESTKPKLTLARFQKCETTFGLSPWVTKMDTLLRFAKADYSYMPSVPYKAPRGKLPFLVIENEGKKESIPDSELIYQTLVARKIIPCLYAHLSPESKAQAFAVKTLVETILIPYQMKERWFDHFSETRDIVLGPAPLPVRYGYGYVIFRKSRAAFDAQGFLARTPEELQKLLDESLDALETVAKGRSPYLLGQSQPSYLDAVVFAYLATVFAIDGAKFPAKCEPFTYQGIKKRSALIEFMKFIWTEWYPERPLTEF